MKFRVVFGFILLILFFVALFVGLPYLFQKLKFSTTSTMTVPWNFSYFYSQPTSFTYQYQQNQQYQQKVRIGSTANYGATQNSLQSAS